MAPSYANLFMDRLERRLLSQAQVKPYIWLRYINDVFMVWTGTELELVEFLNYINEAHDTIKEAFQGVKATCDTALKTGDMGIFKKREVTCLRC